MKTKQNKERTATWIVAVGEIEMGAWYATYSRMWYNSGRHVCIILQFKVLMEILPVTIRHPIKS